MLAARRRLSLPQVLPRRARPAAWRCSRRGTSPFADVAFCPTGGITAASAPDFLALANVKVVGGSWLTPADAIARGRLGAHRGGSREAMPRAL